MKIEGLDWIDIASSVRGNVHEEKPAPEVFEVRGALAEMKPSGHGSVEYYLTEDGTLIRLENAELCGPLDYANLLE